MATTDFSTASLYATLRAGSPPQLPRMADYSVEARHPHADERTLLEVDDRIPMLVATQVAFNQDGRPLELTVATYRGDRYRFRASITDQPPSPTDGAPAVVRWPDGARRAPQTTQSSAGDPGAERQRTPEMDACSSSSNTVCPPATSPGAIPLR